jgi:hypothetical protein
MRGAISRCRATSTLVSRGDANQSINAEDDLPSEERHQSPSRGGVDPEYEQLLCSL